MALKGFKIQGRGEKQTHGAGKSFNCFEGECQKLAVPLLCSTTTQNVNILSETGDDI